MIEPNLFKFATSELSQDAFICWLLSWAKKDYKIGDDKQKALHKIANSVLALFFKKAGKTLPFSIETIVVKRQVSNIDILCIINDSYCVLIEDKVGSIQHSDQLIRYKEIILNGDSQTFEEDKVIPIYLQTHDQSNYKKVIQDGFYPVLRIDLLNIFNSEENEALKYSDIYTNFNNYIQSIENKVQIFKSQEVSKWQKYAWIGFFQYLQEQLKEGSWKYVSNESGGFMGFWTFKHRVDDNDIYLLLEQDKICFKVSVANKRNRSDVRSQFYKLFVASSPSFDLKVVKPKRFGSGKNMTCAILDTDVININSNGLVDLKQVDELMNKLQAFISHVVSQYKRQVIK